jgi:aspartate racemase
LLATEGTLKTGIYHNFFCKNYRLVLPNARIQKDSVNKAIKLVKMGKVKEAEISLRAAVKFLIRKKCKKIILGCTELPIAIFAYKSFRKAKESKLFIDPNLLLAEVCMNKYKRK